MRESSSVITTSKAPLLSKTRNKISMIIPVHNEASELPHLLSSLVRLQMDELIFVEGGSEDETAALLQAWSHQETPSYKRVSLSSSRGRGTQMNTGAQRATGDILLFLHADTTLPLEGIQVIHDKMKDTAIVGGAFRLRIGSKHPFLRFVTWVANMRSAFLGLPYGDQAYFVRKDVFEQMEGFRTMALMEDVDFIRRLKKEGKVVLLNQAVTTSARRWLKQGIYWVSFRNMTLLCLYYMGVSPNKLARWYQSSSPTKISH